MSQFHTTVRPIAHRVSCAASIASVVAAFSFGASAVAQQAAKPAARTYTVSSSPAAMNSNKKVIQSSFVNTQLGTCPEAPPLENYNITGQTVSVPGFIQGEEEAVVLNVPADQFPIEILRIRIGWSSVSGGQPDSLEDSILIYPGGLPNPGPSQYSIGGPVLVDGAINEFDLTTAQGGVGSRIVNSGPFMVSLRMGNTQNISSPAPIHDGNGCQTGKNAIFASPAFAWFDACSLGVSGDWIMSVTYRPVNCGGFTDCNNNGQDDAAEIAANPALDCDLNGELDSCQIAADPSLDANNNGVLDSCETPTTCTADVNGDGVVNGIDLANILVNWGACPN